MREGGSADSDSEVKGSEYWFSAATNLAVLPTSLCHQPPDSTTPKDAGDNSISQQAEDSAEKKVVVESEETNVSCSGADPVALCRRVVVVALVGGGFRVGFGFVLAGGGGIQIRFAIRNICRGPFLSSGSLSLGSSSVVGE